MWNIFKVKNKDTRTTLLTSSVSIVDFKQVNAGWDRDSNPWKISMKMLSLANFQASFPLQVWFKNFERRCSWQKKQKNKKQIELFLQKPQKPSIRHFKMLLQTCREWKYKICNFSKNWTSSQVSHKYNNSF